MLAASNLLPRCAIAPPTPTGRHCTLPYPSGRRCTLPYPSGSLGSDLGVGTLGSHPWSFSAAVLERYGHSTRLVRSGTPSHVSGRGVWLFRKDRG